MPRAREWRQERRKLSTNPKRGAEHFAPDPDAESRKTSLLDLAERAHANDELYRARNAYSMLLALAPAHPIARRGIAEIDAEIIGLCRERSIQATRILRLMVPVESVPDEIHDAAEGAVLAVLVSGEWLNVADVLAHCALPELCVLEVMVRLIDRGILAVW